MALDKYKKLLSKKKELIGKKSDNNTTTGKKEFVPYFNPNKNINKGNFTVRILPNKNNGELFFIQFKKHSFKIGSSWKNAFCFYSHNSNGEVAGSSCPFCDFIELNKEDMDDNSIYKLSAKNSHILFIYNYQEKKIQKIEVNDYGITDILAAIQGNLDDNMDIDKEGFDLIYTKGSSGYAEVLSAKKPTMSLEEVLNEVTNYKEIPDLEKEVIPPYIPPIIKTIESTLSLAIAAFEPTFLKSNNNTSSTSEDEEDDLKNLDNISEETEEYDPNDDIESESETIEPKGIEEGDDETIEGIESFLKSRKK